MLPGRPGSLRVTRSARNVIWLPLEDHQWSSQRWHATETLIEKARIFARVSKPDENTGLPIVMLHGLVVSGAYFGPVARRLEAGFHIYIPDMPGFGRSWTSGIPDIDGTTEALNRWMDIHALRHTLVVANSLGCQVATMLAVRHPERVSRMVLIAPTMDPDINGPASLVVRGLIDIPRETQTLWKIWIPDFFSSGIVRALKTMLFGFADQQTARLLHVNQPVLCVSGEIDPICPPAWVKRYGSELLCSHYHMIRGAAHAMNYSAPDALGRLIADWAVSRDS